MIERLRWIETVLAPTLRDATRAVGGVDLKATQAKALLMGDEVHSRNAAATLQFLAVVAVGLAMTCAIVDETRQSFVPTRTGTPRDVALDVCGASTAALLMASAQRRRGSVEASARKRVAARE